MLKQKSKPKAGTFKRKRDNYEKEKIKKLVKYLRSEFGSCTTHGVPYIVNTELHWFERFLWTFCIVISGAIIFILISAQYERYLMAPTIMSVEMDYFNWNVSFPAITLCPLNKIGDERGIVQNLSQRGEDPDALESYLEAISLASLDSINLLQIPPADIVHLVNSRDYAMIAAQTFRRFDNSSFITNTNWSMSIEAVMTERGMCHVINSNVAVFDNPRNWNETDVKLYTQNTIQLSLYDKNFLVQVLNYADSYKVYAHSPNDIIVIGTPTGMPVDDEGVLSFGVEITSTRASPDLRALALYLRKCRFVDEPHNERYPVYSYNRCLMECRIRMIKIFCGCLPHFYKPLEGEHVCDLLELKCLFDYIKEISTLSVNDETIEKFGNVDALPKNFRDCGCLGDCEPDYYYKVSEAFHAQDDTKLLKIVLAKFPKLRILKEIIFSFTDIMLRSGSIVNLCLGTSIISVMELIIIIVRIPIHEIVKQFKRIWRKIIKVVCRPCLLYVRRLVGKDHN